MGSKVSPEGIETELALLSRFLDRLEESFTLEKEEALKTGLPGLTLFRERCRTHYQLRVTEIRTRVRQLCYTARRAGALTPGMHELAGHLESRCGDALARYEGTPNRLMRFARSTMNEEEMK
ncbi:MAG: hypothetical protein R6V62_01245 [Candidatus Fermentibacteraceae bacterium]